MTDERKLRLFDELVSYICEVVNDDEEIVKVFKRLGFTQEEVADEVTM